MDLLRVNSSYYVSISVVVWSWRFISLTLFLFQQYLGKPSEIVNVIVNVHLK